MAPPSNPFSVLSAIAAALCLASCSSARIDPLEFDYYASAGDPVEASAPVPMQRPERDPVTPLADPVAIPLVSVDATRTHRVEKGDSLYALSRRFLGAGKRWREIAQLNGIGEGDVRRIPVGREVKIPAR